MVQKQISGRSSIRFRVLALDASYESSNLSALTKSMGPDERDWPYTPCPRYVGPGQGDYPNTPSPGPYRSRRREIMGWHVPRGRRTLATFVWRVRFSSGPPINRLWCKWAARWAVTPAVQDRGLVDGPICPLHYIG